jgi:hypothetical protein
VSTSDKQSVIQEFRLSDLAEEFTEQSSAEIERLRSTQPDFDETLYQHAVELVLRKLNQRDPRDIR